MMSLPAAELVRRSTSTGEKGRQIGGRKWRPGLNAQGAKSRKPRNSSAPSGDFSEIEATIHRLCDARGDDDASAKGAGVTAEVTERHAHRRRDKAREDHRRISNGEQAHMISALAKKRGPSVDFCGYWQRGKSAWHSG
jgi:hypothetical protein